MYNLHIGFFVVGICRFLRGKDPNEIAEKEGASKKCSSFQLPKPFAVNRPLELE